MAAPLRRPSIAGHRLPPSGADDLVACAGIWRDSINDYLGRLNQPDIPDDLAAILRLYAHLLPPIRTGSSSPSGPSPTGRRPSSRSPHPCGASRCGSSRCCSSCRTPGARASGRALLAAGHAGDRAGRGPRARARTAPSRSRTGCTPRSGSCPRMPLLRLVGRPSAGRLPPLPAGVERGAVRRLDGARRPGADLDDERGALDRATRGLRAPPGPRPRARGGPDRRSCIATAAAGRRLRLRRRRSGGSGRSRSATRRCWRRSSATCSDASGPAGAFGVWVPGAAGEAIVRAPPGRLPDRRIPDACSAGTARSPTSPATCRSRRACSRPTPTGRLEPTRVACWSEVPRGGWRSCTGRW